VPIASWLNNIEVAEFALRNFAVDMGTPLQTWVFPQDRVAASAPSKCPPPGAGILLQCRRPVPLRKLADVEAAGMGGGMEHASEIFYGERSVNGRPVSSLVWHEVSINGSAIR